MGVLEETLKAIISEQVEPLQKELEALRKELSVAEDNDVWLKVGEAAKLLGCDPKHIHKLIDSGFLSLAFLPGTNRGDKRISKKELIELKAKFTIVARSRL